jgi:DNA invertase Pin-like site-specific DNA recombinase
MKTKEEEKEMIIRYHERGHFQKNLRDEIIKSIEDGTPRGVIVYQYGVSRSTLCDWMRNHGSKDYQVKQRGNHLTEVEKRTIVRQVEQGSLTPHAARKIYGLSGSTLNRWLKGSVKENAELAVYDPFEMKDKAADQPDLPDPEKEALKKALEEAQLKISALNTLIDVAEDQFKIKIRKKAGARQS